MTNTTPAPIGVDTALALLVAAVEAETDPSWECNSYHPSLWSALDVARAALARAAPAAVAEHEVLCWVPEDELPESITSDAYNTLFQYSRVDGIRWFPVFGQSAQTTQPAVQQEDAASTEFFLQLPQRPKPEAPAGTVGLDWDAYSGAQILAYGRDCSDAAIVATKKTGCV